MRNVRFGGRCPRRERRGGACAAAEAAMARRWLSPPKGKDGARSLPRRPRA